MKNQTFKISLEGSGSKKGMFFISNGAFKHSNFKKFECSIEPHFEFLILQLKSGLLAQVNNEINIAIT